MTETTETTEIAAPNPFASNAWKSEPTPAPTPIVATDPVIEEKDEQIREDKPVSDKPDEPEKEPKATPHPIQEPPRKHRP